VAKGGAAADDGTVTFVESRSKLMKVVAICAGFTLVGSVFVATGGPDSGRGSGPLSIAVMFAGLLMGLFGLAYFVPRLVGSPRVLLLLDDDGFDDKASPMPAGRVQWTEVTELKLVRIAGEEAVAARVADPESLQRGRGRVARFTAAMNRRRADVWIAGSTLPIPAADVLDQMLVRWERSTGGRTPGE